jgi:hypothetical protein
VDSQLFFLVFIPGFTIAAFAIGLGFSVLAFTQGPFQPATKRGLVTLTVVVVLAVALGVLAFRIDHPALPHPGA